MIRKTHLYYYCIIASLVVAYGCSKKKSEPQPAKFTGCRITTIINDYGPGVGGSPDTIKVSYNDDGTVARIADRTFIYRNNYIKAVYDISRYDSIQLDNKGRITFINHYDGQTLYIPNWESFDYDSVGNLILRTIRNGSKMSTENYYWKDGDLQWVSYNNSVSYFTYGTDLYNTGNILARLADFTDYGRAIYTPKHFPKSVNGNDYNFVLDGQGKLVACKRLDLIGPNVTSKVIYSCN